MANKQLYVCEICSSSNLVFHAEVIWHWELQDFVVVGETQKAKCLSCNSNINGLLLETKELKEKEKNYEEISSRVVM
mgnify:FL=1|tara:strand:+ start:337 stop:567 length:231 start_codon:yes stop_codon:yes gene_type:complete